MKRALLLLLLLISTFVALAQNIDTTNQKQTFTFVEQNANFPGGTDAFDRYIAKNIKYPKKAFAAKTQGKVSISFTVERDGALSNIKVLRGVSPELDAEAIRVMEKSPRWLPAIQNGRAVSVQYIVPITFQLPGYTQLDSLNKQEPHPTGHN